MQPLLSFLCTNISVKLFENYFVVLRPPKYYERVYGLFDKNCAVQT